MLLILHFHHRFPFVTLITCSQTGDKEVNSPPPQKKHTTLTRTILTLKHQDLLNNQHCPALAVTKCRDQPRLLPTVVRQFRYLTKSCTATDVAAVILGDLYI